jgi:glutamate racemase
MKIGFFDSGIGGLITLSGVVKKLPDYDFVYLGDTARVPYGNRSEETIAQFTQEGIKYLLKEEDCRLVIIACNTASSDALRNIQQKFLPKKYSDRKVLGVIIPTVEEVVQRSFKRIGLIGTIATINSHTYEEELDKLGYTGKVFTQKTPLLVPLVENNELEYSVSILRDYLSILIKENIEALILGCTHYALFKKNIRDMLGDNVVVFSQDEIIGEKLKNYLENHTEINLNLDRNGEIKFLLTDLTESSREIGSQWFGRSIDFELVKYY